MKVQSSATSSAGALFLGAVGVLAFSVSLPATRIAVERLDPWFVAFGRAVFAALLALVYLRVTGAPRPRRWGRLLVVALGVVVGFPLFTSIALTTSTSSHGAVVVAVLPAMTAVFAVLRAGERPPPLFWAASLGGVLAVLGFLVLAGSLGSSGGFSRADGFLLVAVTLCGLGYAEGGALAREIGGAATIAWALVLSSPATVVVTVVAAVARPPSAGASGWTAFAYLGAVSMFLGFVAWYAGLARGGIARVGQLQLAQPVLTMAWSALLVGESIAPYSLAAALVVIAFVVLTQRSRAAP